MPFIPPPPAFILVVGVFDVEFGGDFRDPLFDGLGVFVAELLPAIFESMGRQDG